MNEFPKRKWIPNQSVDSETSYTVASYNFAESLKVHIGFFISQNSCYQNTKNFLNHHCISIDYNRVTKSTRNKHRQIIFITTKPQILWPTRKLKKFYHLSTGYWLSTRKSKYVNIFLVVRRLIPARLKI